MENRVAVFLESWTKFSRRDCTGFLRTECK